MPIEVYMVVALLCGGAKFPKNCQIELIDCIRTNSELGAWTSPVGAAIEKCIKQGITK